MELAALAAALTRLTDLEALRVPHTLVGALPPNLSLVAIEMDCRERMEAEDDAMSFDEVFWVAEKREKREKREK